MTIAKSTRKNASGAADPPTRGRRGQQTREKVEEAAGRLFTERGYAPTTVQAIADAAGVHVQTVYLAYGTKAAVLAATATRLIAGDEDPDSHPADRQWAREIMATDDPERKIRLYVRHVREVAPRVIRLVDQLRATAPDDPDVAEFLTRMQEGRREGPYALLQSVHAAGQLRTGLTLSTAADITYTLASFDTFRALVEDRGWTWSRAENWIIEQLHHALLAEQP